MLVELFTHSDSALDVIAIVTKWITTAVSHGLIGSKMHHASKFMFTTDLSHQIRLSNISTIPWDLISEHLAQYLVYLWITIATIIQQNRLYIILITQCYYMTRNITQSSRDQYLHGIWLHNTYPTITITSLATRYNRRNHYKFDNHITFYQKHILKFWLVLALTRKIMMIQWNYHTIDSHARSQCI